jgi:hypothetical protein
MVRNHRVMMSQEGSGIQGGPRNTKTVFFCKNNKGIAVESCIEFLWHNPE